jgi:hypothetical protein
MQLYIQFGSTNEDAFIVYFNFYKNVLQEVVQKFILWLIIIYFSAVRCMSLYLFRYLMT